MDQIKEKLCKILQTILYIDAEIDEYLGFFDMGISSLTVFTFCDEIKEQIGANCEDTDIFNYTNICELSEYIYKIKNEDL